MWLFTKIGRAFESRRLRLQSIDEILKAVNQSGVDLTTHFLCEKTSGPNTQDGVEVRRALERMKRERKEYKIHVSLLTPRERLLDTSEGLYWESEATPMPPRGYQLVGRGKNPKYREDMQVCLDRILELAYTHHLEHFDEQVRSLPFEGFKRRHEVLNFAHDIGVLYGGIQEYCGSCSGDGKLYTGDFVYGITEDPCWHCDGTGYVSEQELHAAEVPRSHGGHVLPSNKLFKAIS